jgi:hypothetical protein
MPLSRCPGGYCGLSYSRSTCSASFAGHSTSFTRKSSELVVFLSHMHHAGTPCTFPVFRRARYAVEGVNLWMLVTFLETNERICFASTDVTLVSANQSRRPVQSRVVWWHFIPSLLDPLSRLSVPRNPEDDAVRRTPGDRLPASPLTHTSQ